MEQNTNAHWILGLKHWQLFLLLIGPRILEYPFLATRDPNVDYYWIEISYWMYLLVLLCGWVYFTTINLYPLLPAIAGINLGKFKRAMGFSFFPGFIILGIMLYREVGGNGGSGFFELAVLIGLILFFPTICFFYGMYIMIKTLRGVELHRRVSSSDFGVGDLTIVYPLIGVWVLQPRINKAYELSGIKQQLHVQKE